MKYIQITAGSGGNASRTVASANSRLRATTESLLAEEFKGLPVWIRAPKKGVEHYTGLSRAKLYECAARGYFRSVSIREPGQTKGTRLFELRSILAWIEESHERGTGAEGRATK